MTSAVLPSRNRSKLLFSQNYSRNHLDLKINTPTHKTDIEIQWFGAI